MLAFFATERDCVLQKLADHIKGCLERAEQCREGAARASDPVVRSQLSDLELQWRHCAKSYEFIESLEHFLIRSAKTHLTHRG